MIHLTRLNQTPLVLNADLIEHIETTPDTVVTLTTGQRFIVRESATEIIERVKAFRRSILTRIHIHPDLGVDGSVLSDAAIDNRS